MRILLFSDSHGYTHNMVRGISKNINVDMIIHLGDFVKDAAKLKGSYPDIRFEIIRGNNDWTDEYPIEKVLEVEDERILITHGHLYNVKNDYQRIVARGKSQNVDAIFFGHTHQTEEFFSDGMLLLNPGSISIPARSDNPTYCLIEIKDGKILSRFVGV